MKHTETSKWRRKLALAAGVSATALLGACGTLPSHEVHRDRVGFGEALCQGSLTLEEAIDLCAEHNNQEDSIPAEPY